MSIQRALFDKVITCPLCGKKYNTKKVRSKYTRIISSDTDYCPHYDEEQLNPDLYLTNVCMYCGFSYIDKFACKLPTAQRDSFKKKVADKWKMRSYGDERTLLKGINSLKLALFCGDLMQEKRILLAGVALRIAWLHRKRHEQDEEHRFLKIAHDLYEKSYEIGDYDGSEVPIIRILYLIGECSFRLENYGDALHYYSIATRVKTTSNRDSETLQRVRERWREARTLKKERDEKSSSD